MFTDKIEYREVALGISHDAGVVLQLQQANVTMMIL